MTRPPDDPDVPVDVAVDVGADAGVDVAGLVAEVRARVPAVTDLHVSRGCAGAVRVSLLRIAYEHRGDGHGQAALALVCAWADRHGVTLVGTPEPAHLDGERRVSRARLRRWYTAHGFRPNHGGRNPEYHDAMFRPPRISASDQ